MAFVRQMFLALAFLAPAWGAEGPKAKAKPETIEILNNPRSWPVTAVEAVP